MYVGGHVVIVIEDESELYTVKPAPRRVADFVYVLDYRSATGMPSVMPLNMLYILQAMSIARPR